MGVEIIQGFVQWVHNTFSALHGTSTILAWVGLGILIFLGIIYGGIYLYRAIKAIAYMPIKKFVAMLALTGVALIILAIVIP